MGKGALCRTRYKIFSKYKPCLTYLIPTFFIRSSITDGATGAAPINTSCKDDMS